MPHLGAFVPSNYFAFIYVPVYSKAGVQCDLEPIIESEIERDLRL